MKNVCPLALLICVHSYCQDLNRNIKEPSQSPTSQFDVSVRTPEGIAAAYVNNIPTAVMSSFLEDYDNSTDVSWVVDTRDVTAFFHKDDEDITLTYRNDGTLLCTRRVYEGKLLSRNIRNIVLEEAKKGFTLSYVTEVERGGKVSYEVSLQNETQWLVVRVVQEQGSQPVLISRKDFRKG